MGYTPKIDGNENSYQVANNSKLSICLGSNLGIELISRNLMVFFINIFSNYNKAQTIPYFTTNDSLLVCSKENGEIIRKKISNLLNLDYSKTLKMKYLNILGKFYLIQIIKF